MTESVDSRLWNLLPSRVKELSRGNRRQMSMTSFHDSNRLPPISSEVMLAHSEETD
jgi:hypothetical protein